MTISYVGGMTGGRAGSTSTSAVTYALTGGSDSVPKAGDLVVITVVVGTAARNPSCAIATPAGFSHLGLLNASASTQDTSLDVSYKFMGGTPDTTFTLPSTGNVADAQSYTVQVFRGVDKATPLDVTSTSATGTTSSRADPPSITPSTAGAWIVCCAGGGAGTAATYTFSGLTNVLTTATADTNDSVVGMGYKSDWVSGAYDQSVSSTGENLSTDSWAAYTIALRPSPLLETLTEDFSGSVGANWNAIVNSSANVVGSFTGGVFVADFSGGGGAVCNSYLLSANRYDLRGSSIYGKIKKPRTHDDVDRMALEFTVARGDTGSPISDVMYAYGTSSGSIIVAKRVGFTGTDLSTITTGDLTNTYAWWRWRESGGTLFFDTAPDSAANPPVSGDWTNRWSAAVSTLPMNFSDVCFASYAQIYTSDTQAPTVQPTLDGLNTAANSTNISATFAATESTTDTFAGSVTTCLQVSIAATDAGNTDTFAGTSTVKVAATLAATDTGNTDTFAATSTVTVAATLAATETTTDTFAATSTVTVAATLAATEATSDTFAGTAQVKIAATLAAIEDAVDTFAGTVAVKIAATLTATETTTDTFAATSNVVVAATLAAVESSTPDTFAATSTVTVGATIAATETDVDTFSATVQTVPTINVTFTVTESSVDTTSITAAVVIAGTIAAVESTVDTSSISAQVLIAATLAAVEDEAADTFASTAQVIVAAALAATETTVDTWAATSTVKVAATLAAVESTVDTFAGTSTVKIAVTIAAIEDSVDVFSAQVGTPELNASIAAVESTVDTLSATVSNIIAATLAAAEASVDSFSSTAQVIVTAGASLTENVSDAFVLSGSLQIALVIAGVESDSDTFEASAFGIPTQLYPLAGIQQGYPGVAQLYPLQGTVQDYPL